MSKQEKTTLSLGIIAMFVIAIGPISGSVSVASYQPVDYNEISEAKAERHGQEWPATTIDLSVVEYPPIDYARIYLDKAARHGSPWPAAIID